MNVLQDEDLIYKKEVYAIIGAAMEVHKNLGPGFLEAVYQEALEIELKLQKIPFKSHQTLKIYYKDQELKKQYEADMICYEKIIVEIKAAKELTTMFEAQVLNYLKTTGYKVGVLINFGTPSLQWKRFANTKR